MHSVLFELISIINTFELKSPYMGCIISPTYLRSTLSLLEGVYCIQIK